MTATEILAGRYDFVVVTYHFVMSRHRSYCKARQIFEAIDEFGYAWLMDNLQDKDKMDVESRPCNALFSAIYRELKLPFRHVILDEGHLAKKIGGAIHEAIKALYKERLVILSGTFVSNRWWDLCGIFDLFPRPHPFSTTLRFSKAFADLQNGRFTEPTLSKQNRLVKYLMGFTLARPSVVMDMVNMKVRYHDFVLDDNEASVSAGWALKFALALKWKSGPSRSNEANAARAMMFATRAQQYVSGRILVSPHTKNAEDYIREQGNALLTEFLNSVSQAQQSGDGEQPRSAPSFELTAGMTARLARFTKAGGLKSSPPGVSDQNADTSMSDAKYMSRNASRDKYSAEDEDTDYEDGDSDYSDDDEEVDDDDGDTDDEDADAEDEDIAAELGPTDASNVQHDTNMSEQNVLDELEEVHAKRSRPEWLGTLKNASDSDIFTAKVKATIELIDHLHNTYPTEKILLFSVFLTHLDLVHEALRRANATCTICRIDGTRTKAEIANDLDSFRAAKPDALCLVTAGAGALGMNMEMASKVIQCEPWWNLNNEKQAYYRCRGKAGQKKNVDVFILRGLNAVIDFMIQGTRDKKERVNIKIVAPLRRADDDAPIIPFQFEEGVGEVHGKKRLTKHVQDSRKRKRE
jgi:hypothetical protein